MQAQALFVRRENLRHQPRVDDDSQIAAITRVDMRIQPREGVAVLQYASGWTAGTEPAEMHTNATTTLPEMIEWFEKHGWTVRTWPGGARAWLGRPLPIRSKLEIIRLRTDLERQVRINQGKHPRGFDILALDLALDL